LGSNGEKLRYTQMQRRKETHQKIHENIRRETCLKQDLIILNSGKRDENIKIPSRKTIDSVAFNIYLRNYFSTFDKNEAVYGQKIFRKMKFSSFVNTQKSESNFLKNVKKTFGSSSDTTILIGDWSKTSMKFSACTKGKGFRTMFKRAGYKTFLVDEYLTSSVCPCCKETNLETFKERENPKPWKNNMMKIHGLLRCQSEKCQLKMNDRIVSRLWNRDDVATLNIKETVEEIMDSGERPVYLSRSNFPK
jgi:uncharacterized protein YbaR (Trm112 family)